MVLICDILADILGVGLADTLEVTVRKKEFRAGYAQLGTIDSSCILVAYEMELRLPGVASSTVPIGTTYYSEITHEPHELLSADGDLPVLKDIKAIFSGLTDRNIHCFLINDESGLFEEMFGGDAGIKGEALVSLVDKRISGYAYTHALMKTATDNQYLQ